MSQNLVFKVKEVEGFSPPWAGGAAVAKLLIDDQSVGSRSLVVNHFVLKSGRTTGEMGKHPPPYDEVYYVLRGHALLKLGEPPEVFELEPDTVVFIPGGMGHSVDNTGTEDLELVTIMPGPIRHGVTTTYDERIEAWGTSFRLKPGA